MAKETRPNRLPLCIMLADGNHMAGVLLERIVYWGPHGNAVIPTADGKWIANDRRWWMQEARLLVIAFEDIGVASPGALVNAVTACTDPAWRKQAGGNTAVVSSVARMLADAPKDRRSARQGATQVWRKHVSTSRRCRCTPASTWQLTRPCQ